jgi:flagellar basal body-associated protein FliL
MFQDAASDAGIVLEPEKKKADDFEYFVADPEPIPAKSKEKAAPVVEEPEEDDEDDDDSEYDDDEDDEDYEDDEYDDDEDDDEDNRYDWDLEDDGRKMVIVGIILALVIVAVAAFGISRFMNRDTSSQEEVQTEEEDEEGTLIIKGDDGEDSEESEEIEETEEEPEEVEEEEEEPEEPETITMKVSADSSRVRSEANTNSDVVTTVTNGEQVEVLSDASEEWVQIRCIEQDNIEGYMMSQYLTSVE